MDAHNNFKNKNIVIRGTLLLLLLIFTYFIYLPGVDGIFIFDDFHNLSPIGQYKNLDFWDNFWLFLLEGQSGPTGRPLSLASFYLNTHDWPSSPSGFIRTNILIHLVNGALIFWVNLKLSNIIKLDKTQALIFSFICTALWVLHPMHSTTVLYVIQRMTELSATFTLIGVLFYLYGRNQLQVKPTKGLITLYLGVGLSLLLAVLSKESGALLVAYILVIEFFLLRPFKNNSPKLFNYWLIPSVTLPFIAIIIYLVINTNSDNFTHRNFTLSERLFTEPRILFDYLHHLLIPNMGGLTLFHDDYLISNSLTSPISTLTSVIGLGILFISTFIFRHKYPIFAFATAWFLAGHIIESTVIPLELYFEHRNYMPSYGILFFMTYYATKFFKSNKTVVTSIVSIFVVLYSFIVFQNATLWGKPLELSISWYQAHPNSERSRQTYQQLSESYGIKPDLLKQRESGKTKNSMFYSSSVIISLSRACSNNKLSTDMLDMAVAELKRETISIATATKLNDLMFQWQSKKCKNISVDNMKDFYLELLSLENVKNNINFKKVLHFLLAEIYRMEKDLNNTMEHLNIAYSYYPTYDLLKLRASYLASAGLFEKALYVIKDTSKLKTGIRAKLALKIKQKELDQIKNILIQKISKKQNIIK